MLMLGEMKKLINEFLDRIMEKLNTVMTVYYEEAPNNAKFPYGVVPTISTTPLAYGIQCMFDIEIYVNEITNVNIEKLCDKLRESLDGYNYQNSIMGFHIGYDSQLLIKQNEQDFTYRRISFVARIF